MALMARVANRYLPIEVSLAESTTEGKYASGVVEDQQLIGLNQMGIKKCWQSVDPEEGIRTNRI